MEVALNWHMRTTHGVCVSHGDVRKANVFWDLEVVFFAIEAVSCTRVIWNAWTNQSDYLFIPLIVTGDFVMRHLRRSCSKSCCR